MINERCIILNIHTNKFLKCTARIDINVSLIPDL